MSHVQSIFAYSWVFCIIFNSESNDIILLCLYYMHPTRPLLDATYYFLNTSHITNGHELSLLYGIALSCSVMPLIKILLHVWFIGIIIRAFLIDRMHSENTEPTLLIPAPLASQIPLPITDHSMEPTVCNRGGVSFKYLFNREIFTWEMSYVSLGRKISRHVFIPCSRLFLWNINGIFNKIQHWNMLRWLHLNGFFHEKLIISDFQSEMEKLEGISFLDLSPGPTFMALKLFQALELKEFLTLPGI